MTVTESLGVNEPLSCVHTSKSENYIISSRLLIIEYMFISCETEAKFAWKKRFRSSFK